MLVKATKEQIDYVCSNLRDEDVAEVVALMWSDDSILDSIHAEPCEKFAIVHDGIPCALMGVCNVWPGVGQAWLVGTDEIGKHGVEVAHAAKRIIKAFIDTGTHRIHAYSLGTHSQAHQWLETIGFRREGILQKYGKNKEDFVLYAIVV